MKLSSKSQYGLKACYILALNYEKRSFSASALEKEIGVSGKYLERILRMLSGARIVAAERGVSGGYRLARNPAKITVGDSVRVLEDDLDSVDCINASCDKCASGSVWKRLYEGINGVLDSITLGSLVEDFEGGGVCKCAHMKKEKED